MPKPKPLAKEMTFCLYMGYATAVMHGPRIETLAPGWKSIAEADAQLTWNPSRGRGGAPVCSSVPELSQTFKHRLSV